MYFYTSVYFQTSEKTSEKKYDPDNISEEIFQIYKQAIRKFALNFKLTLGKPNPHSNNRPQVYTIRLVEYVCHPGV